MFMSSISCVTMSSSHCGRGETQHRLHARTQMDSGLLTQVTLPGGGKLDLSAATSQAGGDEAMSSAHWLPWFSSRCGNRPGSSTRRVASRLLGNRVAAARLREQWMARAAAA
jgi:hypothetical protein